MAENEKSPSAAMPLMVGLGFLVVGLVIAMLGKGIAYGSIPGALVALLGVIPGCWAAWVGIQNKESQANLLFGILVVLASCGVAGLLILLRFVSWLR